MAQCSSMQMAAFHINDKANGCQSLALALRVDDHSSGQLAEVFRRAVLLAQDFGPCESWEAKEATSRFPELTFPEPWSSSHWSLAAVRGRFFGLGFGSNRKIRNQLMHLAAALHAAAAIFTRPSWDGLLQQLAAEAAELVRAEQAQRGAAPETSGGPSASEPAHSSATLQQEPTLPERFGSPEPAPTPLTLIKTREGKSDGELALRVMVSRASKDRTVGSASPGSIKKQHPAIIQIIQAKLCCFLITYVGLP
ncbi:unnamed protein product [Durusdinium trenchii]|uniref:Uncharacterized protein n=1 Tax=Durusdinium trenchii TaxID=1381693 RepID=A0ABP0KNT6_9DINO